MKKIFYVCLMWWSYQVVAATGFDINLVQGDFVKGRLQLTHNPTAQSQRLAPADLASKSAVNLRIIFPDQSQRLLLSQVFDQQEFMFSAPVSGVAHFVLEGQQRDLKAAQIRILQHIPLLQQLSDPLENEHPLLQQLAQQLAKHPENKPHLLSQFWAEVEKQGTPLVETLDEKWSRVTFLWRGAKRNVRIFAGPSQDHDFMQSLAGTDLWYKSYKVPNDTHVSYKLAPDVPQLNSKALNLSPREQRRAILATAQADPLNPHPYFSTETDNLQNTDKFNYASQLILPKAKPQGYLYPPTGARGELSAVLFHSKLLANQRRLFIYTPAHFDPEQAYPVLYLFDGLEYTTQVNVPKIVDNMIAEGVIPPLVAVFIENPSLQTRGQELPPNPKFAQALTQELVPFVEQKIGLKAQQRIIGGSSYGGLASAYMSLRYPQFFAKALIMSGSFWWHPKDSPSTQDNYIAYEFAQRETLPQCFFMSAGYFEQGNPSILHSSRHLKDVLLAKGYPVIYREYATAHGYLAWQGIISEGLQALFAHCEN